VGLVYRGGYTCQARVCILNCGRCSEVGVILLLCHLVYAEDFIVTAAFYTKLLIFQF